MQTGAFAGAALAALLIANVAAADDDERAAVAKAIETNIKWCFPEKIRERLYGAVVNDSTFFMFQPDSRATIDGFDAFREIVVGATDVDDYRWQDGMLRFLADRRDRPTKKTPLVERPTQVMLERIIEAVGQLDQLRLSENEPLLTMTNFEAISAYWLGFILDAD